MELSWLETFIALAESKSMRSAASGLGISPATASERLIALEDEIGAQLLHRTPRGSELTEAGRLYIVQAKKLISDWNDIISIVKPMENRLFRHISLGFPCNTMFPGVGRFIDEFILRHREIELSMYNDSDIGIAEGLRSGIVDIFFAFEPLEMVRRDMAVKLVHRSRLGVLIPPDHRLALRTSASLSEFDGETFVLYPPVHDSSMNELQKRVLRESGIRYIEYGGYFSDVMYPLTVQIGCGVTLIPKIMLRNAHPHSVFLELTDDFCDCNIYMLYDPACANPAVKMFLDEFGDDIGRDET